MENIKRLVLENGMKVIVVPQPTSLATTVMVLVQAGSKYESKDLNGLSHFLEHMCFKGTAKRPRPIDIASELDGLGAQYNAFTSQEYTSYYAKVKNESFDKAMDIIADMYLNPTFDTHEIEKEKGVIIEEINMYEDLPPRKVQELFMELVYGDQPAGWSVAGRKEVIKSLTRNDFIAYRDKHYLADATTVVVAGGCDSAYALEKVREYFKHVPSGKKGGKEKVKEEQKNPRELIQHKQSDQTHLVMGFRMFDVFDKRRFALDVLTDILGGGMGSRLFQKIREELGAAYYVRTGADLYSDHGLLVMSAGIQHEKIETVLTAALAEFARVKNDLVGVEELKRAKDHLTGNLFLSIETSDEIGYYYGGQEVMGLTLESPEDVAKRINAVTAEEMREVARAFFTNDRLNLALIGPYEGKSFSDIVKI